VNHKESLMMKKYQQVAFLFMFSQIPISEKMAAM